MEVFCEVGFLVELICFFVEMLGFKFVEDIGDDEDVMSEVEEEVMFIVDESGVVRRKENGYDGVDGDMFLEYGFV